METTTAPQDYAFGATVTQNWPVTSAEDPHNIDGHGPDNYSQSNWEEWMKWDPSSQPNSSPNGHHRQVSIQQLRQGQKAVFDSPQDASYTANQFIDTQGQDPATSSSALFPPTYFTFGETQDRRPAFQFTSAPMSSPAVAHLSAASHFPNAEAFCNDVSTPDSDIRQPVPFSFPPNSTSSQPPQSTPSLQHSPTSVSNTVAESNSTSSSPEPLDSARNNAKKRKSIVIDDDSPANGDDRHPPVKKTAHNMIEKRYRTNLNDKIAALRDSVPSLRVMSRPNGNEEEDDPEDLEGLTPAHKLNKATVLSKATEYIRHLEKRNKRLQDEVNALKNRVNTYEKMTMAGSVASAMNAPDGVHYHDDPFSGSPVTQGSPATSGGMGTPPQGMIPVPENISMLHRAVAGQPHYGQVPNGYAVYPTSAARQHANGAQPIVNGRRGSGLMSKLMVGSLAGLMIVEGLSEREQDGKQPAGRGLFSAPFSLFSGGLGSQPRPGFIGTTSHPYFPLLKFCLVIVALVYVIYGLLDLRPKSKRKSVPSVRLSPAPSLASPVELRRKAWLTAMQTVWVPRHNFFLEAAALCLETLKLSTRRLFGRHGYALLTGSTSEHEQARVRAWDIALDAQLTGGDQEISLTRLLLTVIASGTLPNTPSRLMLKALHVRIVLWQIGKTWHFSQRFCKELGAFWARSYWNAAREEQRALAQRVSENPASASDPGAFDLLPDHQVALLEMHCDEVLVDDIIQRACNLAWNKPSSHGTQPEPVMDRVAEDFAISSPLDALAAWWSKSILKRCLSRYLEASCEAHFQSSRSWSSKSITSKSDVHDDVIDLVSLAHRTAPPGSSAELRALVAKAVLLDGHRQANVARAFSALQEASSASSRFVNCVGQIPIANDVRTAITLVKCLHLSQQRKSPQARLRAIAVMKTIYLPDSGLTLVSFVAAFNVLNAFVQDEALLAGARSGLERLASCLRVWMGRENGSRCGLDNRTRGHVVDRCLRISTSLVGMAGKNDDEDDEGDPGYVSGSDRVSMVTGVEKSLEKA